MTAVNPTRTFRVMKGGDGQDEVFLVNGRESYKVTEVPFRPTPEEDRRIVENGLRFVLGLGRDEKPGTVDP